MENGVVRLGFLAPLNGDDDFPNGRKLNRIPHQIHENLPKAAGIALQGGRYRSEHEPHQFQVFLAGGPGEQFQSFLERVAKIEVNPFKL